MRKVIFTWLLASACLAQRLEVGIASEDLVKRRLEAGLTKQKLRQAAIADLFAAAGCTAEEQKVSGYGANVICTLPGETDSAVTVGGHYDFVDRGQGIVNDWSGVALLPSLYQSMKSHPRKHTYIFVAFTGEEVGLIGSSRYVNKLSRDRRDKLRAYVNLECLGVGPVRVWATRATRPLADRLLETASAVNIPVTGMSLDRVGDDDSHPFLSANIPVITIHSLTSETMALLHSSRDNVKAINFDAYYQAYRLTAFYLATLDARLD